MEDLKMGPQVVSPRVPRLVVPAPPLPVPTSMILEQFGTLRIRPIGQPDRRIGPVHVETRHRILIVSHDHKIGDCR